MKTIIGIMLKGGRAKFILTSFVMLSLVTGFVLMFANDLLARVLNDYLLVQNFDGFALLLLATIGLFVLVFGMNILSAYLRGDFWLSFQTGLTEHYITRLLRAKTSFFTNRPSAELFTKLNDSTGGVGFLIYCVLGIVSHGVIFIFYGIIIFRINLFAGIFAVLVTPLCFFATEWAGNKLSKLMHERMEANGEMSTVTQEAFENVNNVKAKGAFSFFAGRSVKVLGKIKSITVQEVTLEGYIFGITALVRIIAPLLIILAAMQLNFGGGAAYIMLLYINIPLFLGRFENLFVLYVEYKAAKPFLSQLREFDNVEPESENGEEITTFESLRTDAVKVKFPGGRVVAVPDFEVKKGEKIGFFGESGIGKSTVFNIIMGLNQEYEGTVLLNGTDLRKISTASRRRVFGITFQHTNALALNLRENILLGAVKSDAELERLIKLTALESQQASKGEDIVNNKVLSGGEKSRLGLSQMLVTEPEIMLIDEAFSSMDEELECAIINDLFREYPQRTVICISHRISSKQFFDRTVNFS